MSRLSSSKKQYKAFRADPTRRPEPSSPAADRPTRDRGLRKHYLRQYRKWLWPYRGTLVVILVLALLSVGAGLVLPLATRYVVDEVLPAADLSSQTKLSRLTLVCGAMLALLLFVQCIDTIRWYMMVVLTIGVLIFLSWQMALIAGLMIPPIVLINLLYIQRVRPIYRTMAEERERIDARVTETFGGIRVVRAFRRERREVRDYAVGHHTIIRKNLLAERLQLVVNSGWGLLIPATTLAIVGFGSYRVVRGHGTIGDIIAFQMYALMLLHTVSLIVNSYSATQQALAALERVFDILERPQEKPDLPHAFAAPYPIQEFRFDAVGFEYRRDLPVLRDVSL